MSSDHSHDATDRLVYLAAERTLAAWVRTALSLMALGFVIDRFDLVLRKVLKGNALDALHSHQLWTWSGAVLIAMGILMVVGASVHYLRFARRYRRDDSTALGHSLVAGALFSVLIAAAGIFLLVVLITTLR